MKNENEKLIGLYIDKRIDKLIKEKARVEKRSVSKWLLILIEKELGITDDFYIKEEE